MKDYSNNFDFEKWSSLASTDPEAFEQYRKQVINNFIQDLPEEKQQRMRCLQWRVDSIRRLAKTPLAACIEISNMMWDSIKGKNGLLEALHGLTDPYTADAATPQAPVRTTGSEPNVLKFPGKSRKKADLATQDLL